MNRQLPSNRSYTELIRLPTFLERFHYLKLSGSVGAETFALDRTLNQNFYKSRAWAKTRDYILIRDYGRDLGVPGYELLCGIVVHHMNPITIEDIEMRRPNVLDPEGLICVSNNTHHAIHFSDESLLVTLPPERYPGDTTPWKQRR